MKAKKKVSAKAFEKKDMPMDKKKGIKENSMADKAMDKKMMKSMKGAKTIAKIVIKAKPMKAKKK